MTRALRESWILVPVLRRLGPLRGARRQTRSARASLRSRPSCFRRPSGTPLDRYQARNSRRLPRNSLHWGSHHLCDSRFGYRCPRHTRREDRSPHPQRSSEPHTALPVRTPGARREGIAHRTHTPPGRWRPRSCPARSRRWFDTRHSRDLPHRFRLGRKVEVQGSRCLPGTPHKARPRTLRSRSRCRPSTGDTSSDRRIDWRRRSLEGSRARSCKPVPNLRAATDRCIARTN